MRVVETIYPNAAFRSYTCEEMFTEQYISDTYHSLEEIKQKISPATFELFESLKRVKFLKEPSISKYSIRVGIEEAFEDSEKDWTTIRNAVFMGIALFHGVEVSSLDITVKDDRQKYDQGEREVVSIYGLYEKLDKIAIPHDFRTHRDAWRNALVKAKKEADSIKHLDDANSHYWSYELKVFDAAFSALEALKLPEK